MAHAGYITVTRQELSSRVYSMRNRSIFRSVAQLQTHESCSPMGETRLSSFCHISLIEFGTNVF